jgi:hypothetical protein
MTTTRIRALKPNVSQDEALRQFSSASPGTLYWRLRNGPLRRIALVYVPFFLYRVRYELGHATQTRLFALDAVTGSLDLFEFPTIPTGADLLTPETRNYIHPRLTAARAADLLREKTLRLIFQQGFFKLRQPTLDIFRQRINLHLPYWLAFHGNQTARCRVLDAIRRCIEGPKASAFFEEWLTA